MELYRTSSGQATHTMCPCPIVYPPWVQTPRFQPPRYVVPRRLEWPDSGVRSLTSLRPAGGSPATRQSCHGRQHGGWAFFGVDGTGGIESLETDRASLSLGTHGEHGGLVEARVWAAVHVRHFCTPRYVCWLGHLCGPREARPSSGQAQASLARGQLKASREAPGLGRALPAKR